MANLAENPKIWLTQWVDEFDRMTFSNDDALLFPADNVLFFNSSVFASDYFGDTLQKKFEKRHFSLKTSLLICQSHFSTTSDVFLV